ncbi:DUF3090 family protein [Cryobacterium frigoriphilum]|uniref:DUF3090 family protein n=1 Tax=Cryobacterium frigoriphilum TaxID=1259150 RepID=A0A4R8ZVB9_9MICO|nr:DUF3090 domain-containing protein [Cryobacterium frigoriphilum]TFD46983.1 DUF3090 family protein [Cryobacterium frigoriphilum]
MTSIVHEFDWPDRVVIGTIGLPGERTFYLQVRSGSRLVSIALEKQQSTLLSNRIDAVLDEMMSTTGNPFSVPSGTPIELVDNEPLEPVVEQFRAGDMGVGWSSRTAQFIIHVHATLAEEEMDVAPAEPTERLVLLIPVGTARAFAKRTREVVGAGRPMCPLCGDPIDAAGHSCSLLDFP